MASKKEKNNNSRQQQSMTKEQKKALKTVQQSIPIVRIYEDGGEKSPLTGVIETADGVFTKSYMIYDTNYSDAGEERQEEILDVFSKILTTFSVDCGYEITVNNRTVDQEEFNKRVLIDYQNDEVQPVH